MGKRLYVGNLSFNATEMDLRDLFADSGTVAEAKLVMDRDTGRPRGFGFVEMANDDESQAAIDALNGTPYGGRPLTVNEARPREERGGGGGTGRGRSWRGSAPWRRRPGRSTRARTTLSRRASRRGFCSRRSRTRRVAVR